MSGGFGTGFGSVPFGGADLDALALTLVIQLSANLLAVPGLAGENLEAALDAKNWTITPLDPDAHPRLVQSAQQVTEDNSQGFALPQLILVNTLPAVLLAADGVLTYGKRYRLALSNAAFDFTALNVSATSAPADVRTDDGFIWDIANPYLSRDALVFPPQLGTYQVTDAGDLGVDKSGESSLRKRIVRRVLSAASSYFHLLGYGVGVDLKGTISTDMLRRLSARINAQALQEPEAQKVASRLSQTIDPSVISCAIDVTTDRGLVQAVVPIRLP